MNTIKLFVEMPMYDPYSFELFYYTTILLYTIYISSITERMDNKTGNWEGLRKQARALENEIDLKLVSFSKLGTNYKVKTSKSLL